MCTCCFFGHRTIDETEEMITKTANAIEYLITSKNVDTFLFGSRSNFDSLCLRLISELKGTYPHIKRVYVRAEYPVISNQYKSYLLKSYDETYYPHKIIRAGKAVYVERNCEMINKSKYCIIYYNKQIGNNSKSGTKIALDYAIKQGKEIIFI